MVKENASIEQKSTYDISDVEIFSVGVWNGDKYTEDDLDDMVKNFEKLKGKLSPVLKLGHDDNQKLIQTDGFPAIGWISELKRKGKFLMAKFSDVPEVIYSLMRKRAYDKISSEVYWNLKDNGTTHRRVLKAAALLGADIPAVDNLGSILDLYTKEYTENNYDKIKIYTDKEDSMELEKKVQELESEIKTYNENIEKVNTENKELKAENEKLIDEREKAEYAKKETETKAYFDAQVKEGKLTPAKAEGFVKILMGETKDEAKEYSSTFELIKGIVEGEDGPDFKEKTHAVDEKKKPEVKDDKEYTDVEIDVQAKAYMKENKCTYIEAIEALEEV